MAKKSINNPNNWQPWLTSENIQFNSSDCQSILSDLIYRRNSSFVFRYLLSDIWQPWATLRQNIHCSKLLITSTKLKKMHQVYWTQMIIEDTFPYWAGGRCC